MSEIIKILKQIGLIGLVIGGLGTLGFTINNIVPWSYLAVIFALFRRTILVIDFMWDTTATIQFLGWSITIWGAAWLFRATLAVYKWLR